ncbi:MAG: hypothetical protein RI977_1105, partial [Bacteroidota bacterium]
FYVANGLQIGTGIGSAEDAGIGDEKHREQQQNGCQTQRIFGVFKPMEKAVHGYSP